MNISILRPILLPILLLGAPACQDSPPVQDAPANGATGAGPSDALPPNAQASSGGPPPAQPGTGGAPLMEVQDQNQQHPPLPTENPAWDWDAGGFVSDVGWYGEHSWADVRMRVAGHISAAGRDRARVLAQRGDLTQAATAYAELARELDAIPTPGSGIARRIVRPLQAAAHRDAVLLGALAVKTAPPAEGDGIAAARARYLGLALRHAKGEDVADDARALQSQLGPHLAVDSRLDIDAFDNFDDRHILRVALVDAYVEALDPLGLEERWGYWRPGEARRQALIIGLSAGLLGGEDWAWKLEGALEGTMPDVSGVPAIRWPSALAEALHEPDQAADFTVEELGWLPTGDSLIDTGGGPGPRAIGTLTRLGIDDPEHRERLTTWEQELDGLLGTQPADVPAAVARITDTLDAFGHGSRFYNIKQARNAAVRQLARAGHPDAALLVLRTNWPLHNQDWACPNRDGILLALEGRLLAEANQPDASLEVLERSLQASTDFLANVTAAERARPGEGPGQRPPMGPGPPGGKGPIGPNGAKGPPGGRGHHSQGGPQGGPQHKGPPPG
jgi:hypothetical protein